MVLYKWLGEAVPSENHVHQAVRGAARAVRADGTVPGSHAAGECPAGAALHLICHIKWVLLLTCSTHYLLSIPGRAHLLVSTTKCRHALQVLLLSSLQQHPHLARDARSVFLPIIMTAGKSCLTAPHPTQVVTIAGITD